MEEFGFALRVAREKRGLTQTQVMQLTGINNKTLSGYENGISEPDLDTLAALLRLYGASADRLLGLEPGTGLFRMSDVRYNFDGGEISRGRTVFCPQVLPLKLVRRNR